MQVRNQKNIMELNLVSQSSLSWLFLHQFTAQKMKFSVKHLFSKDDQIRRKLRIWSHLLKKSLMENFILCAVDVPLYKEGRSSSNEHPPSCFMPLKSITFATVSYLQQIVSLSMGILLYPSRQKSVWKYYLKWSIIWI